MTHRKILNYLLASFLLFPSGLSLFQAFHRHENRICLAESESHIHTDTINCDTFHNIKLSLDDPNFVEEELSLDFSLIESSFHFSDSPYFKLKFSSSGRAPPVFKIV